jgi:hypothetical protein
VLSSWFSLICDILAMIDRALGMAGLAFTIIGIVVITLFPQINRKLAWAGLILGLLLLVAAGVVLFLPIGQAQGPTFNGNCNNFGNNNFNCNTLNFGPSRATFSDELGGQLLAHMPEKKPVSLQTVGSAADQQVGDSVKKFLEDHGFTVKRMSIGVMAPPPDRPFSFLDTPNQYVITVAPSAH